MDVIIGRRSIRRYQDRLVPEDVVERLLKAAMAAPSAGDEQPWHFLVIRSSEKRVGVARVHPYAQMVKQAPVAIIVCGDPRLEKYDGFWVQDCSAATENLLLSARALGLGAVWCGVHPVGERETALRSVLGIPQEIVPFAVVAVGYPADEPAPADRYKPERVHRGSW
ncbi:nitroreductase family protein [Candidatus Bipolaricaulota bacterium]|nr:nitroreductase family protein [Candidatus Bipolaricaulota bacterium]